MFQRLLASFLMVLVLAGCATVKPEPAERALHKVEISVSKHTENGKSMLIYTARIIDSNDEILAAPKVMAPENQVASVKMTKSYEPREKFLKKLDTRNFGTVELDGFGLWFWLRGSGDGPISGTALVRNFNGDTGEKKFAETLEIAEFVFPQFQDGVTQTYLVP